MADDPDGHLTWRDLNHLRRDIAEDRSVMERRLDAKIDQALSMAAAARASAEKAHERFRNIVYTMGGGVAFAIAVLSLWNAVILPILGLLRSAP